MSKQRDPLLLEVVAAIGAGNMDMRPIHDGDEPIHGFMEWDTGKATVNPAKALVDTAIHEIIHRLRPKWSEATVRQRTGKLMKALSADEVDRLYTIVLSVAEAKKSKKRV